MVKSQDVTSFGCFWYQQPAARAHDHQTGRPPPKGGTTPRVSIAVSQIAVQAPTMTKKYGGHWEIIESLGEGGQAHTFKVRDCTSPEENKFYVLKRLKNTKRLARFKAEVDATLLLDHRNIIKTIAHDLTGKQPYLVNPYCSGGSLHQWMENHPLSLDERIRLFVTIADAVNHAHSMRPQIIHRDLKPENIFIDLPAIVPVVGDFGLCLIVESEAGRHTETEEAVGARNYMAPELEDGRLDQVTPACDVYSLGKILYWLVSGGKIFAREKLRDAKWNLSHTLQHDYEQGFNPIGEHLTRILEMMIQTDVAARAKLSEVIISTKRVRDLISRGVNAVGSDVPQKCTYCGLGEYQMVAKRTKVDEFGLRPVGNADWRISVCDECGHVQMFRLDPVGGRLMRIDRWNVKQ